MQRQIWVCLICVIAPHSNGSVQIRVGLELAERLRRVEQEEGKMAGGTGVQNRKKGRKWLFVPCKAGGAKSECQTY